MLQTYLPVIIVVVAKFTVIVKFDQTKMIRKCIHEIINVCQVHELKILFTPAVRPRCDQPEVSVHVVVEMNMKFKYPTQCGDSASCKQKFCDNILNQLMSLPKKTSMSFKFDDGSSSDLDLSSCKPPPTVPPKTMKVTTAPTITPGNNF